MAQETNTASTLEGQGEIKSSINISISGMRNAPPKAIMILGTTKESIGRTEDVTKLISTALLINPPSPEGFILRLQRLATWHMLIEMYVQYGVSK